MFSVPVARALIKQVLKSKKEKEEEKELTVVEEDVEEDEDSELEDESDLGKSKKKNAKKKPIRRRRERGLHEVPHSEPYQQPQGKKAFRFCCHICNYFNFKSDALGNHINVVHYKMKRYHCYKCGKGEIFIVIGSITKNILVFLFLTK